MNIVKLIDNKKTQWAIAIIAVIVAVFALSSCSTNADVASANLSKDAEQFKIERQIVFFNGITDKYLLTIEGRCSIEDAGGQLEVTCKTGEDSYTKDFLGLSDNVSYFAHQLEGADVDVYRYKVIFKPETVIPDINLSTSQNGK